MKHRIFALMMLLLAMMVAAKAGPVDVNRAKQVGAKFVNANTDLRATAQDLRLATTYRTTEGIAAFHVFNMPENGWVIVAADDCATPILAYSTEGLFDENNLPPAMQEYLESFVEEIGYGIGSRLPALDTVVHQWQLVEATGQLTDDRSNLVVEPLLTTKWGQGGVVNYINPNYTIHKYSYYNLFCPWDPDGANGHAVTGCVATAMAQIMNYWRWPIHGSGSHGYTPSGYPHQWANFESTYYDWDNMPDKLTDHQTQTPNVQDSAVALLMWHCGVSVNMKYGSNDSGTDTGNADDALEDYFRYSTDANFKKKVGGIPYYTDSKWLGFIRSDLEKGRPILYRGRNFWQTKNHAFVVDGIDANDLMHINWGWNGQDNAYFALGSLSPDAANCSFNYWHAAVFNIHPNMNIYYQITTEVDPVAANSPYIGNVGYSNYNNILSHTNIYGINETCTLFAEIPWGYHFLNWTNEDGEVVSTNRVYQFKVKKRRNETYVAHFEPNRCNISASMIPNEVGYVDFGNDPPYYGSHFYYYGDTCTLKARIYLDKVNHYHFVNWKRNGAVVSTDRFYHLTVTGDAHYVATFAKNNYTITTTASPSAYGAVYGAGNYEDGSVCTLRAAPYYSDYRFVNWTKNGTVVSTNPYYSFQVFESAQYVAHFAKRSYEVIPEAFPNAGGIVTGGGNFEQGSTCTLHATPSTGYHFLYWLKSGHVVSTDPIYSFTVGASCMYYACFAKDSYVINAWANSEERGIVTGTGTYDYGVNCTLVATPNEGYSFGFWALNGVGNIASTDPTFVFPVTGPRYYVAHFNKNAYTITTNSFPIEGGTVTGSGTYYYGESCTLTATPDEGYQFVNWTLAGVEVSTNPIYSFTVSASNSSVNYQANFEIAVAFDTYSLEFDEFGTGAEAVTVTITMGSHFQSEPILNGVPDWVTASISPDHTSIEIAVSENPMTENRTCSLTLSVDGFTSLPLQIFQGGTAPAVFYLEPPYFTLQYNDHNWQTVWVNYMAHVQNPSAPEATLTKVSMGDGTDWLTLEDWDPLTKSFRFHLSDYTDILPPQRQVGVRVTMTGTDGTACCEMVTIYQDSSGISLNITPGWVDLDSVPFCVPDTLTYTVSYRDIDPTEHSHVWLEICSDSYYNGSVDISPEYYNITQSSLGGVEFTVIYTTDEASNDFIKLQAHIGTYGDPDGLISTPAILNATGLSPYNVSEKITSLEMLNSIPSFYGYLYDDSGENVVDSLRAIGMSIVCESLHVQAKYLYYEYDGTIYGEEFNSLDGYGFFDLNDGSYIIYLMQGYLAWDSEQNLYVNYDVSLDTPEDLANIPTQCKWTIDFDDDGNAIISPYLDQNYSFRCKSHISTNSPDPEATTLVYLFECVTEGGTPVQLYHHIDGELSEPLLTSGVEYFMDGDSLAFTLAPLENLGVVYRLNDGDTLTATEPVTFTVTETTRVSASSYTFCDTIFWPGQIEHTYFKIVPIAEARANAVESPNVLGEAYAVKGTVTEVIDLSDPDIRNFRIFIQDETGGIRVDYTTFYDDPDLVVIEEGDEVIFSGLPMYYADNPNDVFLNEAEFGVKLDSAIEVEPLVKTIAELQSSGAGGYSDMLVKVKNAMVVVDPTFGDQYGLTDGVRIMLFPMHRDTIVLNNGDIIDLIAIYTGSDAFVYVKEVTVKEGLAASLQAFDDKTLNSPNPAWDSHLYYCDAEGNAISLGTIYSDDVVRFAIEDEYKVGLNEDWFPVAAVCDAETGEVLYDSYNNFLLATSELGGDPNRLFTFTMPDVDVIVKVWLREAVAEYTIAVSANPEAAGTLIGGGIYAEGSICTLTATPNEGYTFVNWTQNGEEVTNGNLFSFIVTENAAFIAHFETGPDSYAITATASPEQGGDVSGSGIYAEDFTCTLTATANEGWQFINWTRDGEEVSTEVSYSFTVTEDATFVAHFGEFTSTIVTLANPNNGGTVSEGGTYNFGETATLTATADEGYTFINWTKYGTEVSTDATYSFTVTESATFVANFEQDTYEITATTDPIDGGTVTGAGIYSHGTAITLTAVASADYTFTGWTKDGETVSTDSLYTFIVTEDAAFVAHFVLNSYTVTAFANPSYAGMVTGGGTFSPGDTCILTASSDIGFGFIGWLGVTGEIVSTEETYSFAVTEEGIFVANFEEVFVNHYTISATVNPVEGGIIYDADIYAEGEVCTLIAEAYPGYTFESWTRDGEVVSTETTYSFIVTEDADFVANFSGESVYFTVSALASPVEGGTVSGGGSYAYGMTCNLTVSANEGYAFVNWTEDGTVISVEDTLSFLVLENLELVANFEGISGASFAVNATANPTDGGTVTGAGTYDLGAMATLTATANEGFTFVNWTKNGTEVSTEPTYTFTVMEAASYVANFSLNSYEITAVANPTDGGTISGGGTYNHGQNCTLTATANEGYTFTNWSKDGTEVSTSAIFTFTVTESADYVANFEMLVFETYVITATANPIGGGTITGTGTYNLGATCTLTATANEGYTFLYWSNNGVLLSTETTYAFTVTGDLNCTARFHLGNDTVQIAPATSGWTWWSTYIEQSGIDGLAQLEEILDNNGIQIKTQVGYANYYEGIGWMGTLTSINNESSYKIKTISPCVIEMAGEETTSASHPITIDFGWNWIGYPVSTGMSVATAFSDITPTNGDQVKGQDGYANYYEGMGWMGTLSTITPGMGLLYKSNSSVSFTLTYPTGSKGEILAENITAENNHWVPDMHAYSDNMTVTAVVELDDEELKSENYELAAFANGECRGSVKLMYIEPLNRHIAFLTIAGEGTETLSFGLYNTQTGEEIHDAEEWINFNNNATLGDLRTPYVIHFRGLTGLDEWANNIHVFPNPVARGEMVRLGITGEELGKVQIEIINALGVVETQSVASQQTITAPMVAGVYTLRITVEGKGTCYRKLVVR